MVIDTQNKRIIKILKMFTHNNNNQSVSSANIAALLGVSSKTIRNDIKECNTFLKKYGAVFLAEPSVGYVLKINDEKKFMSFKKSQCFNECSGWKKQNIIPSEYNDRVSFIIKELLINALYRKSITETELADELYISLSTLKKYIKDIKKSLYRFNIELVADNTGISLKGKEERIRYCISEYVFNSNDLVDLEKNAFYKEMFTSIKTDDVKKILFDNIQKYNIHLTDIAFKNLLVHIIITMKRVGSKNTTDYEKEEMELLEKSIYFAAAYNIVTDICAILNVDIKNEVYYLTQHFISSKKLMINDDTNGKDIHKILVKQIIQKINAKMGIDFSEDNELISGLIIHLGAAITRLRFNMNIRNEILASIKKGCPLAFEMAIVAGNILEINEKLQMNENELGFLAIHFGAALERKKMFTCPPITAIIVCATGLSTAMFVKSKLQRRFGKTLKIIKVIPLYELTEQLIDGVNFIFTTVPISSIKSTKIIQVEPILTENDMDKIEEKLINDDNENAEDIFFHEDLFFPALQADDKYEILEKLTTVMLKKGYIDEKVKASVFIREKLSSTELGGLVAIPHALENYRDQSIVAVAVLVKPIVWDKEKVQVVFLLSIPKNKCKSWEPIFERLYNYFISEFGVNDLIKNPTFNVLMEKIKR